MTKPNNAAQVAVAAEPCLNLATATALPSVKQTMLMALAFVQHSLEHLVRERCADKHWDDKDVDVDMAVDLALEQIKRLREELPDDRDIFERKWYTAAAAINLGVRVFSRPDSAYFRWLDAVKQQFEVLVSAVEFVHEEEFYAD